MGTTHSGSTWLLDERAAPPSPHPRGTTQGPPLAPIATTPGLEGAPITQVTTTVPPWTLAPWPDT
jgi:hypothetical protein